MAHSASDDEGVELQPLTDAAFDAEPSEELHFAPKRARLTIFQRIRKALFLFVPTLCSPTSGVFPSLRKHSRHPPQQSALFFPHFRFSDFLAQLSYCVGWIAVSFVVLSLAVMFTVVTKVPIVFLV
jgi:hypothetical protein